jgi:WD40 repeat protein
MAFNSLGDALVTGGGDNKVKIWNVKTGKDMQTLANFGKSISDVAVSLDNEYLLASCLDNKVSLYKLKTMRVQNTFASHTDCVNACRFKYHKKHAITGGMDRTIKHWDIEKGQLASSNILTSQCMDLAVSLTQ